MFGRPTSGSRFERYSGLELSRGDHFALEVGQNTVAATGELGDVETQNIGRLRLQLGMLETIYRNDHDFLSLAGIDTGPLPTPWGGGTDHGLTAALGLNVDLAKHDWAPELFGDVFLEQVGASMELNTGRSPVRHESRRTPRVRSGTHSPPRARQR